MGWLLFVSALIFLTVCSESFSKSTAQSEERLAISGRFDKYLVTSETLELVDKRLREANPALASYETSVLFYLYTKSTVNAPQLLVINNATLLKSSNYDSTKKTIVVSHGFMDSVHSDITQSIKNALLTFNDFNVIGIDWSYYTKNIIYSWVAGETSGVGNYVGRFVTFLIEHGLSPENVHLIGHSLGAHVAGFAGKTIQANGHMPARVTGLDPALPGFNGNDDSSRLASTDGKFVDCIHTCAGLLGFDIPICQADFYPNGGVNVQPGCSWLDFGTCSHGRSFEYFAESINSTHHFYSEECEAIVSGTPFDCTNDGAPMGYFAVPENLGEFYLTTASHSPYSLNITAN